jgi:haloalkane dehalogenase
MTFREISAEFPYPSKFIEVRGSRIHYIEEGTGDPVLFIHGNPTSSYLWRNIIPYVAPYGRCIAIDLIGMGKSDKPDIDYRFADHVKYVDGFIEKMELTNITFVIHDWGSALGFNYAMQHETQIKGLAFMEAILKTATWDEFPKGFRMGFKLFRTPVIGWLMIVGMNMFVEQILPKATIRKLTEEEKDRYRAPYRGLKDRKPLWRWPNEIPIEGKPADVAGLVQQYGRKLQESELPKLLFFAHPGGLIRSPMVAWCQQKLKNLKTVDIGPGIHYLQEDNPHLIGSELAQWFKSL